MKEILKDTVKENTKDVDENKLKVKDEVVETKPKKDEKLDKDDNK